MCVYLQLYVGRPARISIERLVQNYTFYNTHENGIKCKIRVNSNEFDSKVFAHTHSHYTCWSASFGLYQKRDKNEHNKILIITHSVCLVGCACSI